MMEVMGMMRMMGMMGMMGSISCTTKDWESFQRAGKTLCGSVRDFWTPTFTRSCIQIWYADTRPRIEALRGWALCKSP